MIIFLFHFLHMRKYFIYGNLRLHTELQSIWHEKKGPKMYLIYIEQIILNI